ncbi:glucosaminidase domain-containing protein [Desulfopila sp. IMCC35008]|uniref:glucosaminidase domain-containing protein n=1 Tax=Desulfopila sp. IMCC35008 TaxID=2653858 RepID=UPI0013D36DBF|nr:glucosaminidase domain-containing protein [Desulfopila sp. IMCC35008]
MTLLRFSGFRFLTLFTVLFLGSFFFPRVSSGISDKGEGYEILIHEGGITEIIEHFKSRKFWGESSHAQDLEVPRIILAVASGRWATESKSIDVGLKKELFYRSIVPMVLLSNELILKERADVEEAGALLEAGAEVNEKQQQRVSDLAERYGVEEENLKDVVVQLMERVDTIPPALALGQAAYESGYGTSRFAREGNALFGQWTYSGQGMKPKEQRASKGNYGVASYKWPFDSVRSYMYNLNTHSAYKPLRDKRASFKKQGKEPRGLELCETLLNYSEKGEEYVSTLKNIITANGLEVVDNAHLRTEPVTLTVGVAPENKEDAEMRIKELRTSGELDRIVKEILGRVE